MRFTPPATRWCHLTWSTVRHDKFFNIAALARFCERALIEECRRRGWRAEAAILPDRVHVLVAVPPHVPREDLIRTIRATATTLARRIGIAPGVGRVWEESCWCSVIANGMAVEAVRRRIRAINTPATTSPP